MIGVEYVYAKSGLRRGILAFNGEFLNKAKRSWFRKFCLGFGGPVNLSKSNKAREYYRAGSSAFNTWNWSPDMAIKASRPK